MSRIATIDAGRRALYPQRHWARESALDSAAAAAAGALRGMLRQWAPQTAERRFVRRVSRAGSGLSGISDRELRQRAVAAGHRMRRSGRLDGMDAAIALAAIREACGRTLGMRPYDVQIAAGYLLLRQTIAEMRTGEGKSLVATIAAIAVALTGTPVHIITVNDYLTGRDAEAMLPVYSLFGLTVGAIKHGMTAAERRAAYDCDVTYCTNKEVAFDYLKDCLVLKDGDSDLQLKCDRFLSGGAGPRKTLLRGLHFAIVDEADSVLIDEARTPLIISGTASDSLSTELLAHALEVAGNLGSDRHFTIMNDERRIELTALGRSQIGRTAAPIGAPEWDSAVLREELVGQALVALHLFHRDHHYIVRDGAVKIVDEHTGRLMEDRFWSAGLHQLIEMKEGCKISTPTATLARMTYQRFFRRYCRLAGMSGTVREVAAELWSVYRLQVSFVATNRRSQMRTYRHRVYLNHARKWNAIGQRVRSINLRGSPILIGTGSVEQSMVASRMLERMNLAHVVLNAEQSRNEAEIVAQAGRQGAITVATNMAGRGTDIKLGAGVDRLGGLHVVMTECHESGRVDRQLRGRCGRQGDPGSFEAFLSMEDDLLRYLDPRSVAAARWLLPVLRGPFGRWVVSLAQRKAERLHARMRRDLLKAEARQSEYLAFSGRRE
ncbi:MAG: prepilin peptidase [Hyphomicrobiaceae bacterium]